VTANQSALPTVASDETQQARPSIISRAEAEAALRAARRLYEAAALVHERRATGAVDSAPLAYRAQASALRVLLQLSGEQPPDNFAELAARARALCLAESLLGDDPAQDLAIIADMHQRFLDFTAQPAPSEDRRYDRAFVRSGEVFGAVQAYLDQRLPGQKASLRSHWRTAIALGLAVLFGLVIGMRLGPKPRPVPENALVVPQASNAAAPITAPRGFEATFFKDKELGQVAATRVDQSIAFDWAGDAPPELAQADEFSVRWVARLRISESGSYTFYLTSDDGSRLFVDDKLVIDSWADHAELTREATLDLGPGAHELRVEYYDHVAVAMVKLEWSSKRFERRLVTKDDLEQK
jgi:hypothetical protein